MRTRQIFACLLTALVAASALALLGLIILRTRQTRHRRRLAAIVADTRTGRRKGGA